MSLSSSFPRGGYGILFWGLVGFGVLAACDVDVTTNINAPDGNGASTGEGGVPGSGGSPTTGGSRTDGGAGGSDDCLPGTFGSTCVACAANDWDDDEDPGTPCVPKTACEPGSSIEDGGDAVTDRTCSACEEGTTSTEENSASCDVHASEIGARGHTCALLSNGALRCFGANSLGQLGYGNVTGDVGDDETLAELGGPGVVAGQEVSLFAAGLEHTCVAGSGSRVRCWGRGFTEGGESFDTGGQVSQLVAGQNHTCALLSTGVVRCWGTGTGGILGYGNTTSISTSAELESAGNVNVGGTVTQLAAGIEHTCALLSTGAVRCWGYGIHGKLGYAATANIGDNETPASAGDVSVGGTVTQITAGGHHTCAILTGGTVRCWGLGATGALGNGDLDSVGDGETPSSVDGVTLPEPAVAVAAGGLHTCALLDSGEVRCWGEGANGRLGYGNTADRATPGAAVSLGFVATAIAAGEAHSCALGENHLLRCWGSGANGRLGYGNTDNVGDSELPSDVEPVPLF